MKLSKYKVIFRYKNITLWRNNKILTNKLTSLKWADLNNKKFRRYFKGNAYYICHYKKLKIERLYYFKFINKQILRKYFVNYKEYNFRKYLLKNCLFLERRLDFNIYKAHFVKSLYEARFFIVKGFILVNNKKITTFNYLLKRNDKVEINKLYFSLVFNSINFKEITDLYYIKNLEIDYKTLSFVFLDKKEFYILHYQNFLKHIYCSRPNKFYSLKKFENTNSKKEIKYKKKKNIKDPKLNNFFKFFDFVLKYYIFLDKKHIFLKKGNYKNFFLTNFETKILINLFKKKYSNFYFRNILLKRIFNYKYNYLYFLNTIFPNFYNFENINNIFINNLKFDIKNDNINFQYFKYYYNLIFKYYIYLLQNYYIYFDNFKIKNSIYSTNDYNFTIFLNSYIFKILFLKNKLNYFYLINFNTKINLDNNYKNYKFRILKYKYIKYVTKKVQQNRKKTKYYLTNNSYINFLYYVSSNQFRLKYYKYTWNSHIQFSKKYDILKKFSNSFLYKYYNISKFGVYPKLYSKHYVYNKLVNNNNINKNNFKNKISNSVRLLIKNRVYFSITSDIYKFVYSSIIKSRISEKNKLKNDFYVLNSLLKNLNLNRQNYINTIRDLKLQYKILNENKNLNYNINIRNIYLLTNLIKFYKNKVLNYNINRYRNNLIILYKSSLKRNKYHSFKYSIFVRRRDRILVEPLEKRVNLYIKYNKPKLILSSNLHKYFLINKIIKQNSIKFFYLNFKHKKFKNFFKLNKYINKNNKNFPIIKNKKESFYIFNLNIINSNLEFNDSLFIKDLFLNLTTRKLNNLYNLLKFDSISLNKIFNYNSKNIIIRDNNNNFYKNLEISKKKLNSNYYFFLLYSNSYKFNQNFKKYVFIRKFNINFKIKNDTDVKNYIKIVKKYKFNFNYLNRNFNQNFKYYNKKYMYLKSLIQNKFNKNIIKVYNPFLSNYFNKINSNIIQIYLYYSFFYKKYKIVKYIFNNYIFKEYLNILDNFIIKNLSIKTYDYSYIKQLYFNLLYSEIFNIKKYDYLFRNNFKYSRKLKIIINYLILINRFYK